MGSDGKKEEMNDSDISANRLSSSSLKEDMMSDSEPAGRISRQPSEASICATEDEEELGHIQLGPKCSIREHLEKDKVYN